MYRGRGVFIQAGERFEETRAYEAQELLRSGKASIVENGGAQTAIVLGAGSISCIMPTKNRRQFVPRAIACYLAQSYGPRELIVMDNGESIADLIPKDPSIRYVRLNSTISTGQLRNFCCQIAGGEFIAHWDDDDWYHPYRLAEQIGAIGPKQVTGYNSILFHGDKGVFSYSGAADYAVGTSLLYRKSYWQANKFKAINVGEDVAFTDAAKPVIVVADGRHRCVASIHAKNTSPRNLNVIDDPKNTTWRRESDSALPKGYFS